MEGSASAEVAGTIVVGVDDTPTSFAAAHAAAELARATGRSLYVLTAYRDDWVDEVGVKGDEWTVTAEDAAMDLARRVSGQVGLPESRVRVGALRGRPAHVLVEEAERVGADLIVVGNRRMHGVARVLGSVAAAVAHAAPCDVYIVKTT